MNISPIKTSLAPMLTVKDGNSAVEFYKTAFDGELVNRMDGPDGKIIIAEMRIDEATFFISEESPEYGNVSPQRNGATTVRLELTIDDPDAFVKKAVAGGGKIIFPMADQDYGWRQGRIADPFGHQWIVGKPLK